MKIEIGESLALSWLKHECKCQVVQLNWKKSNYWHEYGESKEIQKLFKESLTFFNGINRKYEEMHSSQFIQQGEIDALGIQMNEVKAGEIDTIHAVEVAFHENGLNYGGSQETSERIIKKFIRTALSIYQCFGVKNAQIYFLTPSLTNKQIDKVGIINKVKEFFFKNGFDFKFHIYCNDEFLTKVYMPVLETSQSMTDTSELFARSLKLVALMNKGKNEIYAKAQTSSDVIITNDAKIGLIVRESMGFLSEKKLLTQTIIDKLLNEEYSKKTFNIPYPFLIPYTEDDECGFVNGNRRYYAHAYTLNSKDYLLCNHWIDDKSKAPFIEWYHSIAKN